MQTCTAKLIGNMSFPINVYTLFSGLHLFKWHSNGNWNSPPRLHTHYPVLKKLFTAKAKVIRIKSYSVNMQTWIAKHIGINSFLIKVYILVSGLQLFKWYSNGDWNSPPRLQTHYSVHKKLFTVKAKVIHKE